MKELETIVREEVRRRGRVPFAEFMEWALYHPHHGYYTAGPLRTGRQGDFVTNAQAGPLFAKLLVENFCEMWDALGSGRFSLVELGGSDGRLAERVLTAFREKERDRGVTYTLVERSPFAREQARRRLSRFPRVKILESLDALEHIAGVEGCVFSNEFFDALPFHRVVRRDGALHELYVAEVDGRLGEMAGDPSTPRLAAYLREQGVELAEGQKAEVCLLLEEVVAGIARALARGFVLSIDYGEPSPDLYRETRPEGTLQSYARHKRADSLFEDAGARDITAFVDFGRVAALGVRGDLVPLVFASQGTFFLNSGEKLLREAVEMGAGKGQNVSWAAPVQQLVHPDAFGGRFHVLVQGKNVGRPELSGGKVNRVRRVWSETVPKT